VGLSIALLVSLHHATSSDPIYGAKIDGKTCVWDDATWLRSIRFHVGVFLLSSSGQNEPTERFIQPETRKLPAVEARASTSTFIVIDEIVEHVESGLNWKLTNEIDN
jgi:hypothetical protein